LNALHNVILPELATERSKIGLKKLKVWSAGCSTGEEPHTLAMFLMEEKEKLLKDWAFEIQATDLNDNSIKKARTGIYGDYALRNTPDLYKRKYFVPADGNRLKVKDKVKAHITFTRLNLNDDSRMLFMKGMDLIFCCHHQRRRRVYQLSPPQNRRRLRSPAHSHRPWRGLSDWRESLFHLTCRNKVGAPTFGFICAEATVLGGHPRLCSENQDARLRRRSLQKRAKTMGFMGLSTGDWGECFYWFPG
jgi:hypothetical protein